MAKLLSLPEPRSRGSLSLEEALGRRRSRRAFLELSLTLPEVAQLLWSAQGVTHPEGYRTAPSAGATYPLELFLLVDRVYGLAPGVYRYRPEMHALEAWRLGKFLPALYEAALRQEWVVEAAVVFVFAAEFARTEKRYGAQARRYVFVEVGHAAQNLLLEATALELGAVPVGAFEERGVAEAVGLPSKWPPLYLVPVGRPR